MDSYLTWKGWAANRFGAPRPGDDTYFAREVREALRSAPPRDVLEIGFGNGEFLTFGRSRGWKMSGTELLPELVELARQSGVSAYPADVLPDLDDAAFDLIVAFDVLEHIPPDQTLYFLRTLRAKLRDGGRIILRFPNADSWIGNPFQYGDVTHVNAIGVLKMEYYAVATGLKLERVRGGTRRGFRTSWMHGLHAMTAGTLIRVGAAVAHALFFPGLRVVLSSSSVVAVLSRSTEEPDSAVSTIQ